MNSQRLVAESFERCDVGNKLTDTFYDIFLSKSAEIKDLFKDTNFIRQKKLLRASIYILVIQDIETPKAKNIISKIAATHCRGRLNIPPHLYSIWLESLCETIAKIDPQYTAEVEQHWRTVMKEPIKLITEGY